MPVPGTEATFCLANFPFTPDVQTVGATRKHENARFADAELNFDV